MHLGDLTKVLIDTRPLVGVLIFTIFKSGRRPYTVLSKVVTGFDYDIAWSITNVELLREEPAGQGQLAVRIVQICF